MRQLSIQEARRRGAKVTKIPKAEPTKSVTPQQQEKAWLEKALARNPYDQQRETEALNAVLAAVDAMAQRDIRPVVTVQAHENSRKDWTEIELTPERDSSGRISKCTIRRVK